MNDTTDVLLAAAISMLLIKFGDKDARDNRGKVKIGFKAKHLSEILIKARDGGDSTFRKTSNKQHFYFVGNVERNEIQSPKRAVKAPHKPFLSIPRFTIILMYANCIKILPGSFSNVRCR